MASPRSPADAGKANTQDEQHNTPASFTTSNQPHASTQASTGNQTTGNEKPSRPLTADFENVDRILAEQTGLLEKKRLLQLMAMKSKHEAASKSEAPNSPGAMSSIGPITNMPVHMNSVAVQNPPLTADPAATDKDQVLLELMDIQSMRLRFNETITELQCFVEQVSLSVWGLKKRVASEELLREVRVLQDMRAQFPALVGHMGRLANVVEYSLGRLVQHVKALIGEPESPDLAQGLRAIRAHLASTKSGLESLELAVKSLNLVDEIERSSTTSEELSADGSRQADEDRRQRMVLMVCYVDSAKSHLKAMTTGSKGLQQVIINFEAKIMEMS